jgi:hypothetical protein
VNTETLQLGRTKQLIKPKHAAIFAGLALVLVVATPVLAGSVSTDPEPDLACAEGYGSGVLTRYRTTVETPTDSTTWLVTVEFTLDGGSCELTLATYELPGPSFTLPQELYDSMSGTFGEGTHSLTATLPREADQTGCFSQYDFAFGPAIDTLTGSQKYGDRLIRGRIVGSETCSEAAATPTPTPTPEQPVQAGTPTPSPAPEDDVQGGTPTPAPSQPDTAMGAQGGPSSVPTAAFALILLAALGTLGWGNLRTARNRS